MNNKNINLKVSLFISLLGFHTFASCTSTHQALGARNRRNETSCCSRPSWLTWGDFRRKMHTHPKKCWSLMCLGTTTLTAAMISLLYWAVTSTKPGSNAIGFTGVNDDSLGLGLKNFNPNMDAINALKIENIEKMYNDCMKKAEEEGWSHKINNTLIDLENQLAESLKPGETKNQAEERNKLTKKLIKCKKAYKANSKVENPIMVLDKETLDDLKEHHCTKERLKYWIYRGLDPNARDKGSNKTPLLIFTIFCSKSEDIYESSNFLIEKGANMSAKDKAGLTALYAASTKGNLELVRKLLTDPDVDLNAVNKNNHTALHTAAEKGHTDIVTLLLQKPGIKINTKDDHGNTPLHVAAKNNHIDVLDLLLNNSYTKLDITNNQGQGPMDIASSHCSLGAIQKLIDHKHQEIQHIRDLIDIARTTKSKVKKKRNDCDATIKFLESYVNNSTNTPRA